MVLVQVELLQVPGQTPVLEDADLVSGEEEFRNIQTVYFPIFRPLAVVMDRKS